MAKEKTKALVLFSGGLDSRLAAKILQEQGLEVELLNFKLPFGCGCNGNERFAEQNNLKLTVIDCAKQPLLDEYVQMLRHPRHGRGSSMNPCIDCKILIFKKAKEYADKNKIKVIATGEVLGERPMSQTSRALVLIDKEIGFEILRPLSARLLQETLIEKEKIVDRGKLFDIQGRARKTQFELAKKFDISFPTPAGGCLLCEKAYKSRIKDILASEKNITAEQLSSLEKFRHFRSEKTKSKIILGRNEKENIELEQLNKKLSYNIIIPDSPGPTAIFENPADKQLAEELIRVYSSKNLEERKKFEKIRV